MGKTKTLQRVEIKSADQGTVSAVFATYNVIDSDQDVTLPGAFEDGAPVVISSYGHASWGGGLPVGKGQIRTTKSEAIMDGRFFMDTRDGRNTFLVVKALHEDGLGDWSYGYETLEAESGQFDGQDVQFLKKQHVFEVSPVLRGAGVNTRTVAAKSLVKRGLDPKEAERIVERTVVSEYKAAIRPHDTPVTAKAWQGRRVLADLPDTASIADLRAAFAWCDPNGDPEAKSSYRFLHHDGASGEANLRACMTHIATLNSGKSGIPDPDRRGVYNHLAAHLQDGDREPPELRDVSETGPLKFYDETASVMADVSALVDRASEVMALRAPKGKSLAATSIDLLEWLFDDMRRLRTVLDSPQDDAAREYVRFVQSLRHTGE